MLALSTPLPWAGPAGFAGWPAASGASRPCAVTSTRPQGDDGAAALAGSRLSPAALRGARRGRAGERSGRTARRIFDSGALFGVGVPEATVIALLAWFLLGPEELFRLAKATGNWLGELRGFVGEAAKKYEATLDDASTRKAIAGIRETQRTVSEVAASFQAISSTVRDPLNLSSTLNDTLAKYDTKEEPAKSGAASSGTGQEPPKSVAASGTAGQDPKANNSQQPVSGQEESPEELERKIAESRKAAEGLWFSGDAGANGSSKDVLARLESRLEQVDGMVEELEMLREGITKDKEAVQALLKPKAPLADKDKTLVEAVGGSEGAVPAPASNAKAHRAD